jgi:small nuclear ribonucleoprotein D3
MATDAGVPLTLLHEGEGHVVTVELKKGEIYRGMLVNAEDSMNCQLKNVTMTARDGRVSKLEEVFVRGGNVKFIVLPELLKNAPVLKKVATLKRKKDDEDALKGSKKPTRGRK